MAVFYSLIPAVFLLHSVFPFREYFCCLDYTPVSLQAKTGNQLFSLHDIPDQEEKQLFLFFFIHL